jgi:hypothetical protein
MERVQRGLLILPRPDLSSRQAEVVEWRLRAHDGYRIWGLRGQSPFHFAPKGAVIREVSWCDLPQVCQETITDGKVDFVFPVAPGRRLEDRVLDLLRVFQVAVNYSRVELANVKLCGEEPGCEPDEYMIVSRLIGLGIL